MGDVNGKLQLIGCCKVKEVYIPLKQITNLMENIVWCECRYCVLLQTRFHWKKESISRNHWDSWKKKRLEKNYKYRILLYFLSYSLLLFFLKKWLQLYSPPINYSFFQLTRILDKRSMLTSSPIVRPIYHCKWKWKIRLSLKRSLINKLSFKVNYFKCLQI